MNQRPALATPVFASSRKLTLQIDAEATPITGELADGEHAWPFVGWLELASALHIAIEAGRPAAAPDRQSGDITSHEATT